MKKKFLVIGVVVLAALAAIVFWGLNGGDPIVAKEAPSRSEVGSRKGNTPPREKAPRSSETVDSHSSDAPVSEAQSDEEEAPVPMTEEEKREAAEEKLVDAFDAETDHWMDTENTKPPTMAEVEKFHSMFKALPKARKDECLHRALNLIPDENVMLLAGILMDKTEDKELVEMVFNDVLNRDEDVKKPILQTLFKDKTHPCWADTAWILDVTGGIPKK